MKIEIPGVTVAWQPITTAPKDGTPILGCAEGTITVVRWFSMGEYWNLEVTGAGAEDGEWNPTHWRPLPEPPKTEVKETR